MDIELVKLFLKVDFDDDMRAMLSPVSPEQ